MSDRALVVFTGKSWEDIENAGGSGHWVLTPHAVRGMKYALCTRNAHPSEDVGPTSPGPEPHRAAFLAGRISGVRRTGQENGRDRYLVEFDALAPVDVPDFWKGRNPVRYMDVSEVLAKGIDFEKLDFRPLKATVADTECRAAPLSLTIREAKAGLAEKFGVPTDDIEITIKG